MSTNVIVHAHIVQEIATETLAIPVTCTANLTVLDIAHSTEQQDSLRPFSGISLISPSPSEALETIVTLSTDLDPLSLTFSVPPNDEPMDAVQTLRKELLELSGKVSVLQGESRTKSEQISTLEGKVSELEADVVPLADAIQLQCAMDVWLHENGFSAQSGPRKLWVSRNKARLSKSLQMPEAELEDFFKCYRRLGDSKAHIVMSNGVARAVTRVTQNHNDNARFCHLFSSLFKHTVDAELDQAQVFVTRLDSGRDVLPSDRKKKLRKALV